jgi:stage V sporulation protein G
MVAGRNRFMDITEVRVFLKEGPDKKLKAYATVTFDNSFVVRNIKVIQGSNGLFIAMPSRKIKHPCPKCGSRIEAKGRFCSQCGGSLPQQPVTANVTDARAEHKDIAHPITQEFRDTLQKKVLDAYEREVKNPSVEKKSEFEE